MEEEQIKKGKPIIKSILVAGAKMFAIIALVVSLSSVIFTFSLREVYKADTSDSAFKDNKKEYETLKNGEE